MRRSRWSSLVIGLALLFTAAPASASFHLMKVVEVFPGTPAAPQAQYVVIQMYSGNQNFVSGHSIFVYDAAGTRIGQFTFPAAVPIGTSQAKILIATPQAATFFGVTADLAMTATIPLDAGAVCFEALDCVAWGDYTGAGAVGTPFNSPGAVVSNQPGLGLVPGQAIKRRLDIAGGPTTLENADDTQDSANDFVLALPAPRNNASQTGTAPPATCGDSMLGGLEICDDGNTVNGDGCNAACVDEFCGDAMVNDTTETCDDGNAVSGDGCDANCTITACGNGVVTGIEVCDDGNAVSGDGCDTNCTITACGNGVVTGAEVCDDGNATSGDGCDVNCTPTGCGNGVVTTGEDCEPPNVGNCDANCQRYCFVNADCADLDPCTTNERCDATGCVVDPTPTDDLQPCTTDGCDAGGVFHNPLANGTECTLAGNPMRALCISGVCGVARCGDGYIDVNAPGGAEQCDDGNTVPDDGCTNACTLPACGDGVLQAGEQCDDANRAGNDGCSPSCTTERCGDGAIQTGEQCDDGNLDSSDGCSRTCALERCGDGIEQFSEQCDDGNTADGDGCSAACAVEPPPLPEPKPDDGGGCCQTGSAGTGGTALWAAVVMLAITRRRRRRTPSRPS
jgi:MYXO-CTERM domain-containing protein